MKHYRAFGLALTFLCVLAVPRAFGHDADKDKKTHTKETTTTTKTHTKSTTTTTTHSNTNGDSSHQHSSHDSHDSAATDNSGHSHGSSSGDSTHSHGTHQATSSSSSHTSSSHDRNFNHEHVVVTHEHLREAMRVHPGHEERVHAFERSHEERIRFERHVTAIRFVPAHRVVLTRLHIVPTSYYYRRNVFYDTYRWSTPGYVYRMYPRYGLWDAVFLAFALDHIAEEQYALMLYHHRRDAEIQQWMDDTDRLAADNDELRAKMENMKLEMARLEQSGVAVDASYVPPDAEDVALSPEVIDQLTKKEQ
jgi:hypothetical protein